MNEDENVCPDCGTELSEHKELYGQDADGNRGMWIEIVYCKHCGYEE